MAKFIRMPKLSPTMETGILTRWCVKEGDLVKESQLLAEIETDKAIMEVESLNDGTVGFLKQAGLELPVNSIIGCILEQNESAPENWDSFIKDNDVESAVAKPSEIEESPKKDLAVEEGDKKRVFASPLAKKIAAQSKLDLNLLSGTGPRGRVVKADVEAAISKENVSILKSGKAHEDSNDSFEVPLTKMRKVIAERLTQSKQQIPHMYLKKSIKIDSLESFKASMLNVFDKKISLTPFIIRAIGCALRDNPIMNRTWENGKIIQHNSVNISVAIGFDGGLVTPVIRVADKKGIFDIAQELKDLAQRAKDGKIRLDEMQGGTFSLSNLGMFAIDSFVAILNPPQVGILAVGATQTMAIWKNNTWVPEKIMEITLSCDHRVLDGVDAAKFMVSLANYLEHPEGMLI
jgi:pyruvate dehydrogenase E2 component (dihydrolipoamide acetyltransferase)